MLQVLTLENYDNVQFDLADDTNFGALIFILAWVVFGYYILLVLFMAIILEAFESKYDKGAMQDAYLACESFVHLVLWCAVSCWPCRYRNYPMHATASRYVGFTSGYFHHQHVWMYTYTACYCTSQLPLWLCITSHVSCA